MNTCTLCKSSKKDDIQYGEFLKNKSVGVHTFCLYLSSNLLQNGNDDDGFLGFLEADIKKEVLRISQLKCCYCNKRYANIGCCEKKCRRSFHFICGLKNKASNEFHHDFRSYCDIHVRKVKQRPSYSETCLICFESLVAVGKKFDKVNMILTPCCRNGWFHKLCLQKFAKTAGYFFKCPLCNDSKTFREKLPSKGIFIPNQDAAWELEPNAFAELLERPNECAANHCKNKQGRKKSSENNPFVFCCTCGSIAMHKQCLTNKSKQFHCTDCNLHMQSDSGRESLNSEANRGNDEEQPIDVCNLSDKEDIEIINTLIGTSRQISESMGDSDAQIHYADTSDEEMPDTKRHRPKTMMIRESNEEIFLKTNSKVKNNGMRFRTDSIDSERSQESEKDFRKTRITKESGSSEEKCLKYDSEMEDVIKPTAIKNGMRFRTDSVDSDRSQESIIFFRKTCITKEKKSSEETSLKYDSGMEDVMKHAAIKNGMRFRTDSVDSDRSQELIKNFRKTSIPKERKNNEETSLKYDSEMEDVIKPAAIKNGLRFRTDSEDSEKARESKKDFRKTIITKEKERIEEKFLKSDSEKEDVIKPAAIKNGMRFRIDSEDSENFRKTSIPKERKNSEETSLKYDSEMEDVIKPAAIKNGLRFRTDSEDSEKARESKKDFRKTIITKEKERIEEKFLKSDSEEEDVIKPAAIKNGMRFRIDSEDSDRSQKSKKDLRKTSITKERKSSEQTSLKSDSEMEDVVKPAALKKGLRFRTDSQDSEKFQKSKKDLRKTSITKERKSSEETSLKSDSEMEDVTKNEMRFRSSFVDSEKFQESKKDFKKTSSMEERDREIESNEDHLEVKIKQRYVLKNTGSLTDWENSRDSESRKFKDEKVKSSNKNKMKVATELKGGSGKFENNFSSNKADLAISYRKRKVYNTLTDFDNKTMDSKQKRLDSDISNSVDKFMPSNQMLLDTKISYKENNNDQQNIPMMFESDDSDDPLEYFSEIMEKRKKMAALKAENSEIREVLISHQISQAEEVKERSKSSLDVAKASMKKKEISLDFSCIANRTRRKSVVSNNNNNEKTNINEKNPLRTRRKTICAQSLYEKSQYFEKIHESNEHLEILTEQETVKEEYNEKYNQFEFSCIANRTRRRKSLK